MSNSSPIKVHFKVGAESDANNLIKLPLQDGQIAFSIEKIQGGVDKAYIYIDKKDDDEDIQRIKISSEYANRAIADEGGSQISTTYVKYGSLELKENDNHILTYGNNVSGNTGEEVSLPYVLLEGDNMTGNLTTTGSISATNGFNGNLTGNVIGNIDGTSGTFGSITIKGQTSASNTYGSTNPRINFSSNAANNPEIISLIFTDYNDINEDTNHVTELAAPHSLTLRGNGSTEPLFITPRIKVGTKIDTNYAFNADSALIHNWIETTGNYGWKSSTLGGGIYMSDNDTVSIYGFKDFLVPSFTTTPTTSIFEGTLKVGLIDSNSHYAMVVSNAGITLGDASAAQNNNCNLTTINGHVVVNPSKNSNVSYNEGIRINKKGSSSYWSGITLGGANNSTSGTGNGVWFIGCKDGSNDFYLTHNDRDTATLKIIGQLNEGAERGFIIKPRVGINIDSIDSTYTFQVGGNGVSYFSGLAYFGGGLRLHAPGETGIPSNTGIFYNNLSNLSTAPSPTSFGAGQVQFYEDQDDSESNKIKTGRDQKESVILSISGESQHLTHQLSFDVSNTASLDGNLYHRVGIGSTWNAWRILIDNTNVAWSSWTNGTTEGPLANMSFGGTIKTSAAIPSASADYSGVVTTTTQTFAGNKNFAGIITANNSIISLGDNITVGKGASDNTSRSIIVQGKTGSIALTSPTTGNRVVTFTSNTNNTAIDAIVATDTTITFNGSLSGIAEKATSDGSGNNIEETYATQSSLTALSNTVSNLLSENNAMIFKGTMGTSSSSPTPTQIGLPNTYGAGDTYKIVTAGSYAGQQCEVGDLIICIKDKTTTGTSANNADWVVVQANADGIVTGPVSSTSGALVLFNGNTGKIIQQALGVGDSTTPIYINSNGQPEVITSYGGVAAKATKANISTVANAIAYYSDANGTFAYKGSANGALYATSSNGALNWGTLPVGQGGTGLTSFTLNRIYYASAGTTLAASSHYINSSQIGVNTSSPGSYTLYVNGTSYFSNNLSCNATITGSSVKGTSSVEGATVKATSELILPTTAGSTVGSLWIG